MPCPLDVSRGAVSRRLTEGIRKHLGKRKLDKMENDLNPTVFCFSPRLPLMFQGELSAVG